MEEVGKCSHNTANVLEQRQTLRYRPEEQRTLWEHSRRDKRIYCKQIQPFLFRPESLKWKKGCDGPISK